MQAEGGVDNSIAFVQAKPSIVKFLVFLGSLTLSIESNQQNLQHLQYFIIIS